MKTNSVKIAFLSYFITLLLLIVFDGIWLSFVIKRFVTENIGHLMADSVKMGPVFVFYPLYALVITVLVVLPAIQGDFSPWKVLVFGGLLGLAAYGAYDLTNHATLKEWPFLMTVVDMSWGVTMTGVVSVLTFYLSNILIKIIS